MKHILIPAFLIIFAASVINAAEIDDDSMHLSINTGLMVFDRQIAADSIGYWAEAHGGYFVWKSDERVVVRVPDGAAEDFRDFVETISDGIIDYGRSTVDLRQQILQASSVLEAREEILDRNLALLDSSDVEGTLALEKEIRRLMGEIDTSRGALRKLTNDAAFAAVYVNLSFRSQTLPDRRPSNFNWINSVDFYNFISGYQRSDAKRIWGSPIELPEGFARVDDRNGYVGISPQGARFRMVKLENYPEQDSTFWIKALESDLRERGYIPMLTETTLPNFDGESPFRSLLWGMPVGEKDYLYLTALRVTGKYLEFLEMAGPAEEMYDLIR